VDGRVVRIVARRRQFYPWAYPVNLKLQTRSLQMQQGGSLKAVKQLCGFVMAVVSITLPILFSRLHNNTGKTWHAILLKDQENSCVA